MLVTALVLVAAFLLALWAGQRRLMYLPFGRVPSPASVGLGRAEDVVIRTEDGLALGGWFVAAEGGRARATVLVLNGNAGNRSYRAPFAAALARAGVSVLLFDYRGYGGNPGHPTERGLEQDARAALSYLRTRGEPGPIVYFGESLGSGVAVALAARDHPAGLILRSPFTSMVDVGRYHYPFLPVSAFLKDRYESIAHIQYIGCPVLVIAGDRDRVVPRELSSRLFQAAAEPKRLLVVAGADHNDEALLVGDRMIAAILEFVGELGA